MNIFLPGGLGYIGSHTAVELLEKGYDVTILDNLYNSKLDVKDRIEKITNKKVKFYEGDARDEKVLDKIFSENKIDGVINFAGYKAVGESVQKPLYYYENNLNIAIAVLNAMKKHNISKFIFSSTASLYGDENKSFHELLTEDSPIGNITNPYARSKYMIEQMLNDLYISDKFYNICILRYFNPIGSHESGLIGDDPNGFPNNLMPFILKVATGQRESLSVFGNDYDTKDGTGVRDYIHVQDLADAHVKALEYLNKRDSGIDIFNIGTGTGYSVLEVVNCFEKVNNCKVPYVIAPRRPGDVSFIVANPKKANEILNWNAKYDLEKMCSSAYNFAKGTNEEKEE